MIRYIPAFSGGAFEDPLFRAKTVQVADAVQTDPGFLLAQMRFESGFDPRAQNPHGAVGLIQWIPSEARKAGYEPAALRELPALSQLDLVQKYYAPWTGRLKSVEDVSLATFTGGPGIGKGDDFVLYAADSPDEHSRKAYEQNKSMDRGSKGWITVGDATVGPRSLLAAAKSRGSIKVELGGAALPSSSSSSSSGDGLGELVVLGGLAWLWFRYGRGKRHA